MPDIESSLEHTPPPSDHGWTPERRVQFLDHLAQKGNVRSACARVGLSREAAYRLRRRDPLFARGWAAALVLAHDASVEVLADRAIDGIEEDIYYRGELVGTRRRYDSRLLLAHLARLDKLVGEAAAGPDAARFDELLAGIAAPPETEQGDGGDAIPPERQTFIEQASRCAGAEYRRASMENFWDGLEEDEDEEIAEAASKDFLEDLEAEIVEETERAAHEAGCEWDRRRERAFATVDALTARSHAPAAVGLAGAPSVPSVVAPTGLDEPPSKAFVAEELSFPRTLSTVSTTALARALAGPVRPCAATPRSPFSAPRRA